MLKVWASTKSINIILNFKNIKEIDKLDLRKNKGISRMIKYIWVNYDEELEFDALVHVPDLGIYFIIEELTYNTTTNMIEINWKTVSDDRFALVTQDAERYEKILILIVKIELLKTLEGDLLEILTPAYENLKGILKNFRWEAKGDSTVIDVPDLNLYYVVDKVCFDSINDLEWKVYESGTHKELEKSKELSALVKMIAVSKVTENLEKELGDVLDA